VIAEVGKSIVRLELARDTDTDGKYLNVCNTTELQPFEADFAATSFFLFSKSLGLADFLRIRRSTNFRFPGINLTMGDLSSDTSSDGLLKFD
jgi:hypothetical protein